MHEKVGRGVPTAPLAALGEAARWGHRALPIRAYALGGLLGCLDEAAFLYPPMLHLAAR
jgi:hypothetical protein